ncbi:DUF106 domain-containing protein [Candidatus Woesearchaeota archaeon]|nr:DUF106 domain-containing protein [Candidatus Woesearchaeota archaeon]
MAFSNILDPVLGPLLLIDPLLSMFLISLGVSLLMVLIYKFTTNQELMKRLKEEMKAMQKKVRELKNNPDEMMKANKAMMDSNMKYMKQSFKSTLFTMIPLLLIFGWMAANFSYEPIGPGEQFSITLLFNKNASGQAKAEVPAGISIIGEAEKNITGRMATFTFKGEKGEYTGTSSIKLSYKSAEPKIAETVEFKDVLITNGHKYLPKEKQVKNSDLSFISIDYKKRIVLPGLNWGWLGTYILFSIVFSLVLRKAMKVY